MISSSTADRRWKPLGPFGEIADPPGPPATTPHQPRATVGGRGHAPAAAAGTAGAIRTPAAAGSGLPTAFAGTGAEVAGGSVNGAVPPVVLDTDVGPSGVPHRDAEKTPPAWWPPALVAVVTGAAGVGLVAVGGVTLSLASVAGAIGIGVAIGCICIAADAWTQRSDRLAAAPIDAAVLAPPAAVAATTPPAAAGPASAAPATGRAVSPGAAAARPGQCERADAAVQAIADIWVGRPTRAHDGAVAAIVHAYLEDAADDAATPARLDVLHARARLLRGHEARALHRATGAAAASATCLALLPEPGQAVPGAEAPADARLVALQARRVAPLRAALEALAAAPPAALADRTDAAARAVEAASDYFGCPAETFAPLRLTYAAALIALAADAAQGAAHASRAAGLYREAGEELCTFVADGGRLPSRTDPALLAAAPRAFAAVSVHQPGLVEALGCFAAAAPPEAAGELTSQLFRLVHPGLGDPGREVTQAGARIRALLAQYSGPHLQAYTARFTARLRGAAVGLDQQRHMQLQWLDTFERYLRVLVDPDEPPITWDAARSARAFAHVVGHAGAKVLLQQAVHSRCVDPDCSRRARILLGESGQGKSTLARAVAAALGLEAGKNLLQINVEALASPHALKGLGSEYTAPPKSAIVEHMLVHGTRRVVLQLDEVEKAGRADTTAQLGALLAGEGDLVDAYLEVPVDLSQVVVIGTANSFAGLLPHMRGRFNRSSIVLEPLSPAEREKVIVQNLAAVAAYIAERQQVDVQPATVTVPPETVALVQALDRAHDAAMPGMGLRGIEGMAVGVRDALLWRLGQGLPTGTVCAIDAIRPIDVLDSRASAHTWGVATTRVAAFTSSFATADPRPGDRCAVERVRFAQPHVVAWEDDQAGKSLLRVAVAGRSTATAEAQLEAWGASVLAPHGDAARIALQPPGDTLATSILAIYEIDLRAAQALPRAGEDPVRWSWDDQSFTWTLACDDLGLILDARRCDHGLMGNAVAAGAPPPPHPALRDGQLPPLTCTQVRSDDGSSFTPLNFTEVQHVWELTGPQPALELGVRRWTCPWPGTAAAGLESRLRRQSSLALTLSYATHSDLVKERHSSAATIAGFSEGAFSCFRWPAGVPAQQALVRRAVARRLACLWAPRNRNGELDDDAIDDLCRLFDAGNAGTLKVRRVTLLSAILLRLVLAKKDGNDADAGGPITRADLRRALPEVTDWDTHPVLHRVAPTPR